MMSHERKYFLLAIVSLAFCAPMASVFNQRDSSEESGVLYNVTDVQLNLAFSVKALDKITRFTTPVSLFTTFMLKIRVPDKYLTYMYIMYIGYITLAMCIIHITDTALPGGERMSTMEQCH